MFGRLGTLPLGGGNRALAAVRIKTAGWTGYRRILLRAPRAGW